MPSFDLVVAEHAPHDVVAVQRAWKAAGVDCRLSVVEDGEACLNRLRAMVDAGQPVVVLLDWRLPRMHGREVLRAIRASPGLHRVPVVVMTSSRDAQDLKEAYDLGANAFVRKGVHGLVEAIRRLLDFWDQADLPLPESPVAGPA